MFKVYADLMKRTGFTLTELVMVMVLISILAIYLVPRLNALSGWGAQATADRIASVISAARRVAIATRHPIYIQLSTDKIRACFDVSCTNSAMDVTGSVIELNAPSDAIFTTNATSFFFDPGGRSSSTTPILIQMGQTKVSIEPITGLVRVIKK